MNIINESLEQIEILNLSKEELEEVFKIMDEIKREMEK